MRFRRGVNADGTITGIVLQGLLAGGSFGSDGAGRR
jgi:hypothetical protein